MITELFLKGRGRELLSNEEWQALDDAITGIETLPARASMARRGEPIYHSKYLIEGFVYRYMDDVSGRRQLLAVHIPGDFVDLHGYPLRRLDHDIATLTPVKLAAFDHRGLTALIDRRTDLMRMLWFSTLIDAAMHREWIFGLGRLDAEGRVAHFFCEMTTRLRMVDMAAGDRYVLPLTQNDLAEACGMTGVHVNRVLRVLREGGLMSFRSGQVEINDFAGLARLAEYDGAYLYGSQSGWGLARGEKDER